MRPGTRVDWEKRRKKRKKQTNKQAGTLVAVRAWYCTGAESEDRWMRWGEKAERKRENGNRPAPWESGLANLPQPLPLRHSSITAVPAVVLARAHTSPQSRWNIEEQISPTFVTCIFQSDFVQKREKGTANSLPWVFFFSFLIKRLALTSKIFSFAWFFFIFYPPPTLRVGGEISNQISAKQGAGAAEKRHPLKIWYRVFWKWLWEKKKREKKIFLLFRPLLSLPPQPPLSNLHFLISAIKRFASKALSSLTKVRAESYSLKGALFPLVDSVVRSLSESIWARCFIEKDPEEDTGFSREFPCAEGSESRIYSSLPVVVG